MAHPNYNRPVISELALIPYQDAEDIEIRDQVLQLVTGDAVLPCKYKIGISHNPWSRWFFQYWKEGYSVMAIIDKAFSATDMEKLEIYLIAEVPELCKHTRAFCANEHRGGNGAMRRKPPPYYAYVVMGNGALMTSTIPARSHYQTVL
jgi:hypothetical protein